MGWGAETRRSGLGTLFELSGWGTQAVTESEYGSSKAGFLMQCPGLILTWVVVIVCSYRVYPLSQTVMIVCVFSLSPVFLLSSLFDITAMVDWV